MNKETLAFLSSYSHEEKKIDRLLISAFFKLNKLSIQKNELLKGYLITESHDEFESLCEFMSLNEKMSFEHLIELFEFVVSPIDKVISGAVYTPKHIREFIVEDVITNADNIDTLKICDPACGCAGFLFSAAKRLKNISTKSYAEIFEQNIYGLDIQLYSIRRSKLLLSLLAISEGEEEISFSFNLFKGNAFTFNWKTKIADFQGFSKIIGNPPYVCSRNIDLKTRELLKTWEVCKTGHPDLYIPFFQLGIENLAFEGTLSYITVNTFFKSINGRSLRDYFSRNQFDFKIIDFRNEQVFKDKNTYTCICIITKTKSESVKYCLSSNLSLSHEKLIFSTNLYSNLKNKSGWNLGSRDVIAIINKIERFEDKIFPKFSFSTGIATLKNDVYKFKPDSVDRYYYYLRSGESVFPIEKGICRDIINSNKVTTEENLQNLKEKIIFPYQWNKEEAKYRIIAEENFCRNFPFAYSYLNSEKNTLAARDGGEREYSKWYEYGRSQGLNINGIKLFLPHITNNPSFVINKDKKLLFCNGEAIIGDNLDDLQILKKILESKIFWFYISKSSKPYSSEYFSMGKNYLKDFSFPPLSQSERNYLLNENNKDLILEFLLTKYNISKKELLSI